MNTHSNVHAFIPTYIHPLTPTVHYSYVPCISSEIYVTQHNFKGKFWILGLSVGLYQRTQAWSWEEDKKYVVWFIVQVTPSIHLSLTWSCTVPRTRYHCRCCLSEEMYSPALAYMKPAEGWGHGWEQKKQFGEPADQWTALGLSTGLAGSPILWPCWLARWEKGGEGRSL